MLAPLLAAWVATWAASPQEAEHPEQLQQLSLTVRVSAGGSSLRLRLSNEYGKSALILRASVEGRAVKFSGQPLATVAPNGSLVSDPVSLAVKPLASLRVTLEFPRGALATTVHDFGAFSKAPAFLTGIDVEASQPGVVALGDSLTDGLGSTVDANRRWPDVFATLARLPIANQGISGNRVLEELGGPPALQRFERDVLRSPGVKYVIFTEGLNDIGENASAAQVIEGHRQLVARAHAAGLRIFAGTLPPFQGCVQPLQWTPGRERERQAVNEWIRSSRTYDAVIDFDSALRDPSQPTRLLPRFDSGDHAHPNDAGYAAMAHAVDISLFR